MSPGKRGFQGWYLGSTHGDFSRKIPTFETLREYFRVLPSVTEAVLFIPLFTTDLYWQLKRTGNGSLVAYRLQKNGGSERREGHVMELFDQYGEEIGKGPEIPKVVVVSRGYHGATAFMRDNLGFVRELGK